MIGTIFLLALSTIMFLFDGGTTASPVYNLQPAFLTANLGTSGRNIRNLPCVSRKTNQSGICMFAFDCAKVNGTHLGTCVDGFYFGSCCHFKLAIVQSTTEILDNSIDSDDIIPAREPPHRISSTIRPKTEVPILSSTSSSLSVSTEATSGKPFVVTSQEATSSTVPYKLSTFQSVGTAPVTSSTEPIFSMRPHRPTVVPSSSTFVDNEIVTTVTSVVPDEQDEYVTSTVSGTTYVTVPPQIVTWTELETTTTNMELAKANSTVGPTITTTTNTSEEWVPLTTPDSWVLLPSVTTGGTPITNYNVNGSAITTTTATTGTTIPPMNNDGNGTTIITPAVPNGTVDNEAISSTMTTEPIDNGTIENTTTVQQQNTSSTNNNSSTTTTTTSTTAEKTTIHENMQNSTTPVPAFDDRLKPVNMSDYTDVCGRRLVPGARVVGGEKSPFGRWPWQISLRQWRTSTYLHKCGAALLNENWAITAAHCVDNVPPSDLLLRLGEHDLSTDAEPYLHQERRVQIVAAHPQFDPRTFEYDLSLLRFYEPVNFQPNIVPVCVPNSDEDFVGRTAHVTGWGRLYEDGPLPSILQEVSVPVINNTICEQMYRAAGYIEHIPHIFICAGWRRGGFDSCEGDSGGPMVIQRPDDKRFQLAGIISWGIGCAEPNQPGVYTRISEFRDWINQILQF